MFKETLETPKVEAATPAQQQQPSKTDSFKKSSKHQKKDQQQQQNDSDGDGDKQKLLGGKTSGENVKTITETSGGSFRKSTKKQSKLKKIVYI